MTADLHAAWRKQAVCRTSPALFDDMLDVGREPAQDRNARHRQAVAMCATCPVLVQCRADVTVGDEGIRAGKLLATYDHPAALFDTLEREHGTPRGYKQHIDGGDMPACEPCRKANREAMRAYVRSPELKAARMARAKIYKQQKVTCGDCGLTLTRGASQRHKKIHAARNEAA